MPRPSARRRSFAFRIAGGCLAVMASLTPALAAGTESAEIYARHIKGLLAEKCIACHGPLDQQAGLRLDAGKWIHQGGESAPVILPGQPERSELWARVRHPDEASRMPPSAEGTPLNEEELELLRRWIAGGAEYPADETYLAEPRDHWAFQPLVRPAVPALASPTESTAAVAGNPIDAFLAVQRNRLGTRPFARTDDETLLRRWSLGLAGLPPAPALREEFLSAGSRGDASAVAVRRAVDTLLAGPDYPQRWARHWMDVWRYSDWDGYKQELRGSQRHIWHWRDWIIESLAEDKPYDQMVIAMLAADEAAPLDDGALRATGFLARNYHRSNRNIWLDATVEHTAKAFLGLTIACAKCHDHKYDPISQEAYYRFRAIFEPHQTRTDLIAGQADPLVDGLPRVYDADVNAKTAFLIAGDEKRPDETKTIEPAVPEVFGYGLGIEPIAIPPLSAFPNLREPIRQTLLQAKQRRVDECAASLATAEAGADESAKRLAELRVAVARAELTSLASRLEADHAKHLGDDPEHAERTAREAARREREESLGQAALLVAEKRGALQAAQAAAAAVTPEQAEPPKPPQQKRIDDANQALLDAETKLQAATQSILAADESEPQYESAVQAFPRTSTGRRLALARWIVDPRNPLTARVAVNQVWLRHFGKPLVENVFDFGLRSPRPMHHELLDWLAVELIENGWQMKPLHRLIVNSEAYALASSATATTDLMIESENRRLDPDNQTYWRFTPLRLEAEAIRDSLLAVADRLDHRIGGPDLDHGLGETLTRRSLYFRHAYEKQMTMLTTFDAASPNECYRRDASIIPQQALVLSNSALVRQMSHSLATELASRVAATIPASGDSAAADTTAGAVADAETRFITLAFERVLGRRPSESELNACRQFLDDPSPFESAAADADRSELARASLIHVLINHNDFVTVR